MTEDSPAGAALALALVGVTKTFGPARVLDNVDLSLYRGEIHGLVGQNGSGKSTLIKVLSGFHRADTGQVEAGGERHALPLSASQLDALGIAFVHQDLGLVDTASVVDNIRVGRFARGQVSRLVRWQAEAEAAAATLARLGSTVDVRLPAGALSPADRAIVAIARALQSHAEGGGVLAFDESTQSLPHEVLEGFYATVRQLAAAGAAVMLVSHQLDEVLALADRVTVLKDGRVVAAGLPARGLSRRELTRLMLGRDADTRALHDAVPTRPGGAVLSARSLSGRFLRGLDLDLRAGEVVGITGATGSGHDEVPLMLSGAGPGTGSLTVGDRQLDVRRPQVSDFVRAGVALVPQGRATHGLALGLSVLDNLSLPRIRKRSGRWWLTRRWQAEELQWVADTLSLTPRRGDLPAAALSGGNQQKLQIGKWLVASPAVLVLHEPTQAVDVGARRDILRVVRQAAAGGAAVIVVSIDAEDLAAVCDRVLVLENGTAARELTAPLTDSQILNAVFHWEATAPRSAQ
ncbi:MAG TPA: sugar ABC transporter ATP-binding protein [Trebonia sp.]